MLLDYEWEVILQDTSDGREMRASVDGEDRVLSPVCRKGADEEPGDVILTGSSTRGLTF